MKKKRTKRKPELNDRHILHRLDRIYAGIARGIQAKGYRPLSAITGIPASTLVDRVAAPDSLLLHELAILAPIFGARLALTIHDLGGWDNPKPLPTKPATSAAAAHRAA